MEKQRNATNVASVIRLAIINDPKILPSTVREEHHLFTSLTGNYIGNVIKYQAEDNFHTDHILYEWYYAESRKLICSCQYCVAVATIEIGPF